MINANYKVTNQLGMHAKVATEVVRIANLYKSDIMITIRGITANCKSIMGVMSLGISYNESFELSFDGVDEKDAKDRLSLAIIELNLGKEI